MPYVYAFLYCLISVKVMAFCIKMLTSFSPPPFYGKKNFVLKYLVPLNSERFWRRCYHLAWYIKVEVIKIRLKKVSISGEQVWKFPLSFNLILFKPSLIFISILFHSSYMQYTHHLLFRSLSRVSMGVLGSVFKELVKLPRWKKCMYPLCTQSWISKMWKNWV